MKIDADRPIADGIPFDDLQDVPRAAAELLMGRGLVFGTSFQANDKHYAGIIIASCWAEAEKIAFGRGLGERVVGSVSSRIP